MTRYFARATTLLCAWLGATAFISLFVQDGKTPYTTALWVVAPWSLVLGAIVGGFIWGVNNWNARN